MTPLFLLKLISGLLDGTPTKDQIECVKKIVKEMIEEHNIPKDYNQDQRTCQICRGYDSHTTDCPNSKKSELDHEAQTAKEELLK